MAPTGGNLETVQIGPNENNSGGNRGGKNSNLYGDAAMKADAGGFIKLNALRMRIETKLARKRKK